MVNRDTLDAMHRQMFGPNAGAQAAAGQAPANAQPTPAGRSVGARFERLVTTVQAKAAELRTRIALARKRRETEAALAELDTATLRDLGIESRASIPSAASAAVAEDPDSPVYR